jgi:hypothetical protein
MRRADREIWTPEKERIAQEVRARDEANAVANKGPDDRCRVCCDVYVWRACGWMRTAVGYGGKEPCGMVHDDNCRTREFKCAGGHSTLLSERNRCECGWIGKAYCGIGGCGGAKVEKWPEVGP